MFISWKKGLSNSSNSVSSRVAGRGSRTNGANPATREDSVLKLNDWGVIKPYFIHWFGNNFDSSVHWHFLPSL